MSENELEILFMFAGSDDARAYSIEPSGSNLPKEFAPWRFRPEVRTDGPTFQKGSDKAALDEVRKTGFAIALFSSKIEDPDVSC